MSEVKKKLYRSRSDRWLAGVCGGIGDYFNTDPTVIRVIFVLAGLIMGGGLFI
jgi:phage shock protein C